MDLELEGKRAWVVGGSSGLGKAVAASLVAEGSAVAISARDGVRLERAAMELRARARAPIFTFPLDITDREAIQETGRRVTASLGGLDILVANGGGPPPGTFDDVEDAMFVGAFNLLLGSAFRLAKVALPHIKDSKGTIVFVTSSGTKEVLPHLILSNTMRAGVVGMAKTLSKEAGPDGVRVFCVAPGRIATDRVAQLDAAAATRQGIDVAQVRASSTKQIPMGRYGDPREFGDVVAFLVSTRASYITGTTVVIDGGKISTVTS